MDKVYIQIYSVRDPLLKDYVGSIKKLAEIGYNGIEYAISYGGMNPTEMKKLLAECNLDPISSHVGLDKAVDDIPYMAEIGGRYIICPSAASPIRKKRCAPPTSSTRSARNARSTA